MLFKKINTFYKVENTTKCKNEVPVIGCDSNLKLFYFNYFDKSTDILEWCGNFHKIKYTSKFDNKEHEVTIHAKVKSRTTKGDIRDSIFYISSKKSLKRPKNKILLEIWMKRMEKINAIDIYAKENELIFIVLTEENI